MKPVATQLPPSIFERLHREAGRRDMTVYALVRLALWQWVREHEGEELHPAEVAGFEDLITWAHGGSVAAKERS